MTTGQDAKDAREITIVICMAIATILILAYAQPYIFGQVEVKQSVSTTTNNNGITTSIKTTNDKTTIKVLQGGTIELTNKPSEFKIRYCNETCHTHRLDVNGTIQKVSKK
jgi:hypothetical protein